MPEPTNQNRPTLSPIQEAALFLTKSAKDIMVPIDRIPTLSEHTPLAEAIEEMIAKRFGYAVVKDGGQYLLFTERSLLTVVAPQLLIEGTDLSKLFDTPISRFSRINAKPEQTTQSTFLYLARQMRFSGHRRIIIFTPEKDLAGVVSEESFVRSLYSALQQINLIHRDSSVRSTINQLLRAETVSDLETPSNFDDSLAWCPDTLPLLFDFMNRNKVRDFMVPRSSTPTFSADKSVKEAVQTINEFSVTTQVSWGYGCVVDGHDKVKGIFTESDLMRILSGITLIPQNIRNLAYYLNNPVAIHMKPNPLSISPDATIYQALAKVCNGNFRRLPVCNADNTLLGVISERTIFNNIMETLPNVVFSGSESPQAWTHFDGR